jgi:hypothetical protein
MWCTLTSVTVGITNRGRTHAPTMLDEKLVEPKEMGVNSKHIST